MTGQAHVHVHAGTLIVAVTLLCITDKQRTITWVLTHYEVMPDYQPAILSGQAFSKAAHCDVGNKHAHFVLALHCCSISTWKRGCVHVDKLLTCNHTQPEHAASANSMHMLVMWHSSVVASLLLGLMILQCAT